MVRLRAQHKQNIINPLLIHFHIGLAAPEKKIVLNYNKLELQLQQATALSLYRLMRYTCGIIYASYC